MITTKQINFNKRQKDHFQHLCRGQMTKKIGVSWFFKKKLNTITKTVNCVQCPSRTVVSVLCCKLLDYSWNLTCTCVCKMLLYGVSTGPYDLDVTGAKVK